MGLLHLSRRSVGLELVDFACLVSTPEKPAWNLVKKVLENATVARILGSLTGIGEVLELRLGSFV